MVRVTHDGELDRSTCDRNINAQDNSGGGRHPSGCARVDDNDDDDDDGGHNEYDEDDHEDAANDGDGDNDDKNDVNDER